MYVYDDWNRLLLGSHLPSPKGGITPDLPDNQGNIDATGVRFGYHFWLIGGENGFSNENSYLWNIHKKNWIKGPQYIQNTRYDFKYACGLALNSTAVLFAGLKKKFSIFSMADFLDENDRVVPKFTTIFNFERKAWIEQDALNFTQNDVNNIYYEDNRTCAIDHGKNKSRFD